MACEPDICLRELRESMRNSKSIVRTVGLQAKYLNPSKAGMLSNPLDYDIHCSEQTYHSPLCLNGIRGMKIIMNASNMMQTAGSCVFCLLSSGRSDGRESEHN
jgi:hypothetical protein